MSKPGSLTHDLVVEIAGRLEDWKITRILETGASVAELREAQASVVEKGDLEAETQRRTSGNVARLYNILMADQPEWPDGETSS
jgi:hypothetical protein